MELFVFQIFIGVISVKVMTGAQMNTNLDMLPVSCALVHTLSGDDHDTNAQKYSKMLPHWAKCCGGLNWY